MPFNWRSLFSSSGRSDRGRYWTIAALLAMAGAVFQLIIQSFGHNPLVLVFIPVLIAMAVIGVNNSIKRLHDLGRSGWWWLTPFALLFGCCGIGEALMATSAALGFILICLGSLSPIAFVVALGVLRGAPATNRFGAPPVPQGDPSAA